MWSSFKELVKRLAFPCFLVWYFSLLEFERCYSLSLDNNIYILQSPGIKKDKIWEQNLQTMLRGKTSVGFPEIAKILSPEFSQGVMNFKDKSMDSFTENTKGKTSQKKGKSSRK